MYFQEEPEHITILRRQLKRLVEEEMPRELVRQWDRDRHMPRDAIAKMVDLGVSGWAWSHLWRADRRSPCVHGPRRG